MVIKMSLYFKFFCIHLKSVMQYKTSFFLVTIGQFLVSFNVFLGIYFMFTRFHTVKGYTYTEVLLCFSIVLISFSIAEMFARGFDSFSGMVRRGEFDQVLIRPRNEIFLVLCSKIEFTRIGRMIQAVIIFVYAVQMSDIIWTVSKIRTVIFMFLGGVAVFSGLFLIYASLCFFTLQGLEFMNIFTDGAREYGKYPIEIYGKQILWFSTYIIPFALFQYYPFLYLIGKKDLVFYSYLPLLGVIFLIPCLILWKFGVKHYKSSGS